MATGYVKPGYVKPGYVKSGDAEGQPFMVPFVSTNWRLGATIYGAAGALDIPLLPMLVVGLWHLVSVL